MDCSSTLTVTTERSGRDPSESSTVTFAEEAQRADALLRAVEQNAVERVAFVDAHFAANNAVQRAGVADDVDALDEHTRAFIDLET